MGMKNQMEKETQYTVLGSDDGNLGREGEFTICIDINRGKGME